MSSRWSRLSNGETTINFYGRRNIGFIASLVVILISAASLFAQGLNLGIDFKGGVAWEVPVSGDINVDAVRQVLEDNSIKVADAKIQTLTPVSGTARIRAQVGEVGSAVQDAVKKALAEKAGVSANEVNVNEVSSTWGWSITKQAIKALLVFFLFVSAFIAWRFEWKMALAALAAVLHDVLVSVGVYSLFGLEVTPATVVAFLTILGFSLYDTIVVFDKVGDNQELYSGSRVSYGDIVNVSMNQVLMRSLNTSLAAVLPVLSLFVLGSFVMGAVALREFSVALLVGLITGAYSSIYIATPLLGVAKEREDKYASMRGQLSLGAEMSQMIATGVTTRHRARDRQVSHGTPEDAGPTTATASQSVATVLSHPPRPRKKARR